MAISETQKVDYLWKKLAYGLSKTDTNANKRATNESISSPLLLRGANVWAQSNLIPGVIPGSSTNFVTVYPTSSPDETTADSSATLNRTWKTGLIDWISHCILCTLETESKSIIPSIRGRYSVP